MMFEDVLREVDGFGRYQILVFLMLCIPRLMIPMHFLLHNFISASPSHHCALPAFAGTSNLSQDEVFSVGLPREPDGTLNPCKMFSRPQLRLLANSSWELDNASSILSCQDGWVYDSSQYASTTATEWDLVCEKKGMNQAIATFFFIGVTLGSVLFGYLSDRFGRRRMLLLSFLSTMFFGALAAFSESYLMFIIMRSLCGMGLTGVSIISLILAVEWTDVKHRTFCGTISGISWSLGYMLLALVAYLIRTWRWLLLAVTSPCLLSIVIWWWLPESARWLLTKKEVEAAHGYLSRCAKVNGKKEFDSKITPDVSARGLAAPQAMLVNLSSQLLNLSRLCFPCRFGVAFTYYGISLNISGFSLDPYVTHFIFGAIEIPAKVSVYVVLDRIGRRHLRIQGTRQRAFLVHGHLRSAVAILGKGFSEASFTTVFLYTAELFPTVVRQSGVGCCSFIARLASSIAPLIMLLDDTWRYLPPLIFSVVALVSGTVAFLLTETTNIQLPETIEDVEDGRNKKALGTQAHGQGMDGAIPLGLMSQTGTDAPLSQQQEASTECNGKQHCNQTLLANGMDAAGCSEKV
ncbi:solute carrier family 22 member 7-like [Podarcis lilfordi]|uniref:Solute carrier family 22 member 7-like n=1 Tax=Podarcis lilfordi TaxID=74358 RepID=A0AA35K4V2_9SAUR|nr:solute carrier family 22 member 7-like [Podarcis lilfordi]